MRPLFLVSAVLSIALAGGFGANARADASTVFIENLSLGSSGAQVTALQQMLNRSADTRIASAGPGSPGNETSYFGLLTQAAVARFQDKYAREILTPAALARGNGYVGSYTRAKLNALSASSSAIPAQSVHPPMEQSVTVSATTSPPVVPPSTSPVSTTDFQNPNLKNLDAYVAAIDNVATRQGYSAAAIAAMKEQARKQAATTTDLRAAFLKMVQDKSRQSVRNDSLVGKMLATIEKTVGGMFMPEHARAAPVAAPFGGFILYAFPCDGGVWNIELTPLPPAFPALLSYISGSQAFLSYNVPLPDIWLLGMYEPVPMAYCWVGIVPFPSEGLITPEVGSSLAP